MNGFDWLDFPAPDDPRLAKAYWCEMNYFLAHTANGSHPECECPATSGHNHEQFDELKDIHLHTLMAPPTLERKI